MGMDRRIEPNRRPTRKLSIAVGLAIIAGWLLVAFIRSSGTATYRIDRDRVTVSTVVRGRFEDFIQIRGSVTPLRTVYLDAIDGGRVERVLLEEGAIVEAGQLLIELSNTNLQLDVVAREAEVSEQVNNLRNTRLALEQNRLQLKRDLIEIDYQLVRLGKLVERREKLLAANMISRRDYENVLDEFHYNQQRRDLTKERQTQEDGLREAQMRSLEGTIEQLQRNLDIARRNLEKLNIRAPIAGQLTSLVAEVGESKAAGERLGQIDDIDRFKVKALVDEFYITRVQRGQLGEFALQGRSFSLTATKVYPEIEKGQFEIDFVFSGEKPTQIRRGQTLQVRLQLGEPEDALLLAQGGFHQDTGGNWAFVVDESGQFAEKRQLRIGRHNPRNLEVLDGLEEGDAVITSSYAAFAKMDRIELTGSD